jgi:hypothetical protein
MALAAMILAASTLANLTLEVGVNTLQNWSDAIYQDAFWERRDIAAPELDRLAREEAEIARLLVGPSFAVRNAPQTELRPAPR